jgi:hypothetical protein
MRIYLASCKVVWSLKTSAGCGFRTSFPDLKQSNRIVLSFLVDKVSALGAKPDAILDT